MTSAAAPSIAAALRALRQRLSSVCQEAQRTELPTLVAVSKTKPVSALQEAYDAGQLHFGENYVAELVEKAPQLPSALRWHFVGHLQSNKAKALAGVANLHMVESVDNEKIATALNKACAARTDPLLVLIQVNTSGEASQRPHTTTPHTPPPSLAAPSPHSPLLCADALSGKSGCAPSDAASLFSFVLRSCDRLRPCGLMTIGALGPTPPPATCFDTLTTTRDAIVSHLSSSSLPVPSPFELSMGMSGDWPIAVAHGSTLIRVGSAIFGERDYGQQSDPNAKEADAHTTGKEEGE